MAKLVYDIQENRIDDLWTTERLKEEAFLSLAKVQEKIVNEEGASVTVRKYYRQAREKDVLDSHIQTHYTFHYPYLGSF